MAKMPDDMQNVYDNLNGFQRTYCEYRSKGMSMALAAEKAGSGAKDRISMQSVGASIERIPGVKDLVAYFQAERAKVVPIDEVELIAKLRKVYEEAMDEKNFGQCNKSIELMGTMIGVFNGKEKTGPKKPDSKADAFKDEGLDAGATNDRIAKLQSMMKDLNKGG